MKPLHCVATLTGLIFINGLIAIHSAQAAEAKYDLIIRHGKIVDGTGNPWVYGDVAVAGDRIVAVGRTLAGTGKREIDAQGLVVAPGFIDMHTHTDLPILEDGNAQSKIRQGVTTDVVGEGNSVGPFKGKLSPQTVTFGRESVKVSTLGEYLSILDRAGIAMNIASYVGEGQIWECVMGQSFDRPTAAQIQTMKDLIAEAMKDGAFGLSSMVMFPPGSLATADELVALCQVVKQYGGIFQTHIRDEGLTELDAIKEVIAVAERANVPLDILHLKISAQQKWGNMNQIVALIEDSRRRGFDIQANLYPYTRSNNNLGSIIPPWAHEGGRTELLARLRDPAQRVRIKKDIRDGLPGWYNHYTAVGGDWSRMLISDNSTFKGQTMDKVLAQRISGKTPPPDLLDEFLNFLIEQGGSVGTIYNNMKEEDMNLAMVQPLCSFGSDGSALAIDGVLRRGSPHPRSFGTFPRVLGVYVRERGVLRLEEAVRKMTSLNATMLGIRDRGLLRAGNFADITIFDPQRIADRATYEDPFQYPDGIGYVIVNGQIVIDQEKHTGARPGRALRHQAGTN